MAPDPATTYKQDISTSSRDSNHISVCKHTVAFNDLMDLAVISNQYARHCNDEDQRDQDLGLEGMKHPPQIHSRVYDAAHAG